MILPCYSALEIVDAITITIMSNTFQDTALTTFRMLGWMQGQPHKSLTTLLLAALQAEA